MINTQTIEANVLQGLVQLRKASRQLLTVTPAQINEVLLALAEAALEQQAVILAANARDLGRMDPQNPMYDRLLLNPSRLAQIAADLRNVAALPSPLQRELSSQTLPNGMQLQKMTVPLGVVGVVYEARPNVTFDVFALCLKAGNAVVLKGGSDAHDSNQVIVQVIHQVLQQAGLPEVVFLAPSEREALTPILRANDHIDLIIPRGGQGLISYVRQNATVPVIETGAGIVHTYFDASGNLDKGRRIIENAKTRRVSVCNALDTLLIHESRLADLPALVRELGSRHQVRIFADAAAYQVLQGHYPAEYLHPAREEHFGTEFLSLQMSIKTVGSDSEAIAHIDHYSSRHSEAIVAEDPKVIDRFLTQVDAAAVYANASTAFTDGAQFGLGAEIGISTQKLHARGPMALQELCSYKWIIRGDGQIRDQS